MGALLLKFPTNITLSLLTRIEVTELKTLILMWYSICSGNLTYRYYRRKLKIEMIKEIKRGIYLLAKKFNYLRLTYYLPPNS